MIFALDLVIMSSDRIVLSFHDSLLRESDISLLKGPYWLNDQIISFYFEYLSKCVHMQDPVLFVSPEVTQCLKLVTALEMDIFLDPLDAKSKQLVFFAVNNNSLRNSAGGSHWSLLVWSRPEQRFYHYDSMSPANKEVAEGLYESLKVAFDCSLAPFKETVCLRQSNSHDCGIHVIAQAELLARFGSKHLEESLEKVGKLRPQIVDHKREHILSIIESLVENSCNDQPVNVQE